MPSLRHVREKYLWPNFVVSVWLLIGLGVFQFARNFANYESFSVLPRSARMMAAPLVLAGMETALWFMLFRDRGNGTRIMAGFIGVMVFLQLVFVPLVWLGLYDIPLRPTWLLYLYASGMHLLVAVVGVDRRGPE
jgi:hypothetical protein